MNYVKRPLVMLALCALALAAFQASEARADMYLITATLNDYGVLQGYGSGFTVLYNDLDNDMKLGNEDLANGYVLNGGSFSGVTINGYFYPELESVPYTSTDSPYTDGAFWVWTFYDPNPPIQNGYGCDPKGWDYTQTAVIPLPPAALLLGSGLIPLAWARCRKRWRK